MSEIRVVSVDMFLTLVNTDRLVPNVWRDFLGDSYTDELAEKCWSRASEILFRLFYEEVTQKQEYVPLSVIFEKCYIELFDEIGLDYDPRKAADVLAYHHSLSPPYDDALPFLNSVGEKYPICLSSDTNDGMLDELVNIYSFDQVFTSERIRAYKANSGMKFFSAVIDHYGVKPEEIIHIGDSSSDVIGANQAGVVSCWLNRNSKEWRHDIKPDYEVKSLIKAAAILGIEIK